MQRNHHAPQPPRRRAEIPAVQHYERREHDNSLIAILERNLARAREAALRERLATALDRLREEQQS